MKLKEFKCPNCNANISLKENTAKGKCEYCQSEFIIDDENVQIEHTGVIEVTDDTSLKIAQTTLNQFKDYDHSLILYKRLMYKYAHKKEVYIGLIRSITKDFQVDCFKNYQLKEINEYWEKYIALATNKEIGKYEESIKNLNKNHWYKSLIKMTNKFNAKTNGASVEDIEECYNNYLKYCEKNEKDNLDFKYEPYLKDYKLFTKNKKQKIKKIVKSIIISIVAIILIVIIFLLFENTKPTVKSLNLSEINEHYYNLDKDFEYFEKYFKETVSELKVTNVKLNNEDKSVNITVSLKNALREKEKVFTFLIIDDMGPVISPTSCKFTDTDTINVYECFTLFDFTDGKINTNKAKVNTEGIDFKTIGKKTITVTAVDNDGNENKLNVPIIITHTPIELALNLSDTLIVGNTYNLSSTITPNTVSNTSVTYTYDENIVAINNGKINALKKGQTEVCAISNYNNEVKQCKKINLELQCRDTYTFKFDGSKEEVITSDENFCPGTYSIYASVMNKDKFYYLEIKQKDKFSGDRLTIYKNSSFLNEEGSKYNLTKGYTITTEVGITQVKLIKQK